jgi:hypothetical protein
MGGQPSLLGPLALLVLVVILDVWVYVDAHHRSEARRPVVASIGTVVLETPAAWLLACLVLWVLFFPMYLVARSNSE